MAITNPTTPAQYVVILLDLARQRGVGTTALLQGTGLREPELASIGARIGEADFNTVIENAYRHTGDRALGLHLGLRLNLSAHATVGQAFMTCETLEQVLAFFLRYYRILAPALDLDYQRHDGRCWLIPRTRLPLERVEFNYESLFAAMVQTVRFLLNREDWQVSVELPYPAPDYSEEYHAIFGQAVFFDRAAGCISFEDHWLAARLPASNPALRELFEQECQRLLADLEEASSTSEQTLALLRKLEGHYPQMPQVADMLNLSPRTYRRRLAEEQVSFQQLLDRVRAEHASHYLKNTRLPLASIAYMVGFNDASNFRRAYIKWTGRAPREERLGASAGATNDARGA
jgi:AraC-like DNA-binding protein